MSAERPDTIFVWKYRWMKTRSHATIDLVLFAFLVSMGLVGSMGHLGIFGSTIQERIMKSGFPPWVGLILLVFSIIIFFWQLKILMSFSKKYRTSNVSITEFWLMARTSIAWAEVSEVNHLIEPTRNSYMAYVNRRGLWIASPSTWIIVYEELEGYDEFRALVSRECKARGVPMFERDSSWEVVGVKGRGLWAKRGERRGRLARYELRSIDEL